MRSSTGCLTATIGQGRRREHANHSYSRRRCSGGRPARGPRRSPCGPGSDADDPTRRTPSRRQVERGQAPPALSEGDKSDLTMSNLKFRRPVLGNFGPISLLRAFTGTRDRSSQMPHQRGKARPYPPDVPARSRPPGLGGNHSQPHAPTEQKHMWLKPPGATIPLRRGLGLRAEARPRADDRLCPKRRANTNPLGSLVRIGRPPRGQGRRSRPACAGSRPAARTQAARPVIISAPALPVQHHPGPPSRQRSGRGDESVGVSPSRDPALAKGGGKDEHDVRADRHFSTA